MKYLGISPKKLRIAVFDFTGCEGCELQLANREDTLGDFLNLLEIVRFREISTASGEDYQIAMVEGSITRKDEVKRLLEIRRKARVLVALGSCACFGGVNRQKNAFDLEEANRIVYGDRPKHTRATKALREVVKVDLEIPGCPVSKAEIERIVQHLVLEIPYHFPAYSVCFECKQRFTTCVMDKGKLCLGAITRGGCQAPCPAGGLGCWGCRGPTVDPNYTEFFEIARRHGFAEDDAREYLGFFGGFEEVEAL
jgi:sulfhydrogenase subunit delta